MSEGALWLIYLSGAGPAYLLRRVARQRVVFCCLAAGLWSFSVWLGVALRTGIDLSDKWSAVGLWVAFWFGAIFGLIGAGVAIWRE